MTFAKNNARISFIILMGFFSSLFGCNKPSNSTENHSASFTPGVFLTEADFEANRAKQIAMAPQTMEQLRGYGVTGESKLKLEYFFYTNTQEKAKGLANELTERGYDGGHDVAAGDSTQFVITGWTKIMQMSDEIVVAWTSEMCDLGMKFDCEFDGWGTNPNQ